MSPPADLTKRIAAPPGSGLPDVAVTVDPDGALVAVKLCARSRPGGRYASALPTHARDRSHRAGQQIGEYLAGKRRVFDLRWTLPPSFTPFQRAVLETVARIPFGTTRTYGEVAKAAGRPGAARAVGNIMAKNPLPLVIPCHRVVAASGLGGFTGGPKLKAALLAHESQLAMS